MDLQLTGKKALITGGSKGIGRATAELLADEGCDVTLVARDQGALEEAAATNRARRPVTVRTISADLSSDATVRRVAAEASDDRSAEIVRTLTCRRARIAAAAASSTP